MLTPAPGLLDLDPGRLAFGLCSGATALQGCPAAPFFRQLCHPGFQAGDVETDAPVILAGPLGHAEAANDRRKAQAAQAKVWAVESGNQRGGTSLTPGSVVIVHTAEQVGHRSSILRCCLVWRVQPRNPPFERRDAILDIF